MARGGSMSVPSSDGSFRRWTPIALAGLGMVFFGARAAAWQVAEDRNALVHLTPLGERLYQACLLTLPVLPALALLVLLFSGRRTLPSVLTVVAMLLAGVGGAVFGVVQHWPLFGYSSVATVPAPDGTEEAHLFTGGLFCTAFVCVAERRAAQCLEVERRTDLKCETERIEWVDGTPKLMGERSEPFHLFSPH